MGKTLRMWSGKLDQQLDKCLRMKNWVCGSQVYRCALGYWKGGADTVHYWLDVAVLAHARYYLVLQPFFWMVKNIIIISWPFEHINAPYPADICTAHITRKKNSVGFRGIDV